jgi:hypothetical protein
MESVGGEMLDQYFTLLLDLIHIHTPDGYVFGARVGVCRCVAEGDGTQILS